MLLLQKLKLLCLGLLAVTVLVGGGLVLASGRVQAADTPQCTTSEKERHPECTGTVVHIGSDCSGDKTAGGAQKCLKDNSFLKNDVQPVVNVLSGLVGIVVIGSIIVGGLQYTAAGDKPEALAQARKRITRGLIAFVMFLLLFAFVQKLIPGGIFQ